MPLKPSLRAICHYRALSAFTVYNRGGGRNSSVLGGFFWPSVGLLARTAGKSLKPWLLVNEGGLSTVPCCWFAIRIATRDRSRFVGKQEVIRFLPVCPLFRHDQSGPHGHYRDYVGSLPPILLVAYCSFESNSCYTLRATYLLQRISL